MTDSYSFQDFFRKQYFQFGHKKSTPKAENNIHSLLTYLLSNKGGTAAKINKKQKGRYSFISLKTVFEDIEKNANGGGFDISFMSTTLQ